MKGLNLMLKQLFCVLFVFSGCATLDNVQDTHDLDPSLKAYSYTDDLQNTFIKKTKHGVRMCSQPDPDAAQSISDGIDVEAGVGKQENVGLNNSAVGSSLGGRNPEVLILRELMYRACELASNYDVDYKEARALYTEFLKAALITSRTQRGRGVAAVAGSVTNTQNVSGPDSESKSDDD